jgi:hypothetical protein
MSDRSEGTQTWIDKIATPFDRAWRAYVREGGIGQRPRIEDCLAGIDGPERSELLAELLRIELEWRREAREAPTLGEYQARFPGHARTIERLFAGAAPDAALGPVRDVGVLKAGRRAEAEPDPQAVGSGRRGHRRGTALEGDGVSDRSQGTQTWIDKIATPFDRAWRAYVREGGIGQRPRIEDCLGGIHWPQRSELFEKLMRIEVHRRREAGEAPTLGEYQSRFPGHAETIERLFAEAAPAPPLRLVAGGHPLPVVGSADAILFGGSATPARLGRSIFIGTGPCKAGYDAEWGADDAVECFIFFFLPFEPLKSVHIWGGKEGSTKTRAAVIPIRESATLVFQVRLRAWSRAFLACGLFFGAIGAYLWDDFNLWFVSILSVVLGLLGSVWSRRRADRPCKIRILLGPHALGMSDPATWLDDTVAQAVPGLKIWLGVESFAEGAERLLKSDDFRHAMWAARASTACEDRRRGERLTDRILEHPRVSKALEKIRPTASFWRRRL